MRYALCRIYRKGRTQKEAEERVPAFESVKCVSLSSELFFPDLLIFFQLASLG